ncbi:hypothetical protein [Aeromicrobium sp. NPDC092404]|uniref:hypothetical protein n=1 Tax=Aeromicrobium sp. NPDC092404 TaxID=3154976 RepID=UPI00343088EA
MGSDDVAPLASGQTCGWGGPRGQADADGEPIHETCSLSADHVHLIRYIFRLPGYLALPDATTVPAHYPSHDQDGAADSPIVLSTIRQIELEADDDLTLSVRATALLMNKLGFDLDIDSEESPFLKLQRWHSIADIITEDSSPDVPPEDWDGRPQHLGPRSDQFMRALDAVREVARSITLTGRRAPVLPSYERTPMMINFLTAVAFGADRKYPIPPDRSWEVAGLIHLAHLNFPGDGPDDETDSVVDQTIVHWRRCLEARMPGALAREKIVEAGRLLNREGEYGSAIVSACTGVEILCDALLSATLWETHFRDPSADGPDTAARHFGEETPLSRAARQLRPILGGDWNSSRSAWQHFRGEASALRNRFVHAGYSPSRAEVQRGIDHVDAVQDFLIGRLVAKANVYPRTTFLFAGVDGLTARDRYRGQIKKFIEQIAPREAGYIESFGAWHQSLMRAANTTR